MGWNQEECINLETTCNKTKSKRCPYILGRQALPMKFTCKYPVKPRSVLEIWVSTFAAFPSTGFPGGSDGNVDSACNAGDLGSIPGLGRSPGEGNGYLLQYPSLENSIDRGTWQVTVHGVTKSRLSDWTQGHFHASLGRHTWNHKVKATGLRDKHLSMH